ncbi:peptidoglycan DD-metalloendopeptidase family protein [Methylobacterium terricola]
MRTLSRFALIGLIGGASAACSTDAVRLDPFSNPFSSSASGDPGATGSLPEGNAVAAPIRSTPIQSRPLSAPLAAAPLSSRPLAAPVATPRVAAAAPVTGGPAGWSAAGGTTITVGANDSLNQMSTRFGVPAAAILQANGLSSAAQVTPGRQVVIPVYHAGGVPAMSARAVPPAPAPRMAMTETRAPEPVRRVAEAAPRPEPLRRDPEVARREQEATRREQEAARREQEAARREQEAARREQEAESARKAHTRPGQAEAKPVAPNAAERAAKLNPRKAQPREDDEEAVAAKPQRPEPKAVAKAEPKAVAKVAARQQDDDEDEKVAAKPQKPEHKKPEPKAVEKAKPEPKKVAEAVKPEPRKIEIKAEAKPEVKKPEPKQAEAAKPEVKKVAELKPAPKPEPVKPVKVASLPEKAPEPAPAPAVAPAAPAPDPQSSFRWPARGRVINGYGSSGNEGINIAVPEGTPVKAAEEGTVAYAGSDVKGYGKLVLVRHANGYVSAYAHNGEIDVRPGEKVKRGQTIAKSGASGNVTSPQLHFEIRKGATPVDPMPHLASN